MGRKQKYKIGQKLCKPEFVITSMQEVITSMKDNWVNHDMSVKTDIAASIEFVCLSFKTDIAAIL